MSSLTLEVVLGEAGAEIGAGSSNVLKMDVGVPVVDEETPSRLPKTELGGEVAKKQYGCHGITCTV